MVALNFMQRSDLNADNANKIKSSSTFRRQDREASLSREILISRPICLYFNHSIDCLSTPDQLIANQSHPPSNSSPSPVPEILTLTQNHNLLLLTSLFKHNKQTKCQHPAKSSAQRAPPSATAPSSPHNKGRALSSVRQELDSNKQGERDGRVRRGRRMREHSRVGLRGCGIVRLG
jgi:hypothetical protein